LDGGAGCAFVVGWIQAHQFDDGGGDVALLGVSGDFASGGRVGAHYCHPDFVGSFDFAAVTGPIG